MPEDPNTPCSKTMGAREDPCSFSGTMSIESSTIPFRAADVENLPERSARFEKRIIVYCTVVLSIMGTDRRVKIRII